MVSRVTTVAFQGIEAVPVDVQAQISPGMPRFNIVGLADKAVKEASERVRAALFASGLGLPPKRITVNLAPADLPKEGTHFDLPIAMALMAAIGAIPQDALQGILAVGELGLDGRLTATAGTLPAAIAAQARDMRLVCPEAAGPEAAWAGEEIDIIATESLLALVNHLSGHQLAARPVPQRRSEPAGLPDLREVRGQEVARRALEVAAAGGHNLLMIGPPGAGKSMLASRLPSILPPLNPRELLDLSMIQSIAGELADGALSDRRPFRAPHHSASMAALVGGGIKVRPGEASLAHNGVLFLDELPEFSPQVLDSLRQPLEAGESVIARANGRVAYPARFQLVAAMNPCKCGLAGTPGHSCRRGPACAADYQSRVSGPFLDRIDLRIDVPAVTAADMIGPHEAEPSAAVAARVARARDRQRERYLRHGAPDIHTNAAAGPTLIETVVEPDRESQELLLKAAERFSLSARAYHRVLKVARTLADLAGSEKVKRPHIAEALGYRVNLQAG
ncbi:ATP-dependent protease [Youhaiella tibetensis]|uniref:YifB family Mg chelatase-like AAA ATPase n=1 Tax=Paradevosia tibetensis TaxID=1447062 RepID=A0A5B9DWE4_9HYPH|nr:YifB family Mg chelatase-like AAA ATPase [Youhaiella tibetensis]QEE22544.1 YifB family Mg chelatase-like AAA ATPase [Youhaiella tibetensis]GGF41306.1 ATP-dependent protease [Youhaiella tibetensis]